MIETTTYNVTFNDSELSLAAKVKNQGPEWIMCLHGVQSNKDLFEQFLQQSFLAPFSLIALDFIGFGESSKPSNFSYDIQDQATIVEKTMKALHVERVHIIGHSLGGMVATILLEPLKDVVRSFINLEGNLVLSDCGVSKQVADQSFSEFQQNYQQMKSDISTSDTASGAIRANCLNHIPDFAFYKTCQSIVQWSSTGTLLEKFIDAQCSKLFVYGSENISKAGCLPQNIARAKIPNSGHFMLQSNPAACYEAIETFLLKASQKAHDV